MMHGGTASSGRRPSGARACRVFLPRLLLGALCGFFTAASLSASEWPTIEAPPGASVQWVGDDIVLNGVPMQIKAFSSGAVPEQVLAFYRGLWGGGPRPPVENRVGEWSVIGRQVSDFYMTVQVKSGAETGSEGFMGVSRLPQLRETPERDSDFPRLGGTQVISDMKSRDIGKKAHTLIMQNGYSVQSNVQFYESAMPARGWKQTQSKEVDSGTAGRDGGFVLFFNRRKEACHIVVNRSSAGDTLVVVNMVSMDR